MVHELSLGTLSLFDLLKSDRAPIINQSNDFTQASFGDLVSSWGLLAATWVSPKGLYHQKSPQQNFGFPILRRCPSSRLHSPYSCTSLGPVHLEQDFMLSAGRSRGEGMASLTLSEGLIASPCFLLREYQ